MTLRANDMAAVTRADKAHVWHHLTQHGHFDATDPRIIVRGRGMEVWDGTGRRLLNAVAGGVWTVNVGYGRQSIADAVRDQLVEMNYFAQSAGFIPAAQFAEQLLEKIPGMSRVYYSNGLGGEREGVQYGAPDVRTAPWCKRKILSRECDYHGPTLGTLAASGQPQRNAQHGPFPGGFVAVPHCLEYRAMGRGGLCRPGRGRDRGGHSCRMTRRHRPALPRTGGRGRWCHHAPGGLLAARPGDLPQIRHPLTQAVIAEADRRGVIIGMTNRSIPGLNNMLCFSPALIARADQIDEITEAVDAALSAVFPL